MEAMKLEMAALKKQLKGGVKPDKAQDKQVEKALAKSAEMITTAIQNMKKEPQV
jgi:hypothetical protein